MSASLVGIDPKLEMKKLEMMKEPCFGMRAGTVSGGPYNRAHITRVTEVENNAGGFKVETKVSYCGFTMTVCALGSLWTDIDDAWQKGVEACPQCVERYLETK